MIRHVFCAHAEGSCLSFDNGQAWGHSNFIVPADMPENCIKEARGRSDSQCGGWIRSAVPLLNLTRLLNNWLCMMDNKWCQPF